MPIRSVENADMRVPAGGKADQGGPSIPYFFIPYSSDSTANKHGYILIDLYPGEAWHFKKQLKTYLHSNKVMYTTPRQSAEKQIPYDMCYRSIKHLGGS